MGPFKVEWHQNTECWAAQGSFISIVLLMADLSSLCSNVVQVRDVKHVTGFTIMCVLLFFYTWQLFCFRQLYITMAHLNFSFM